MPKYDRILLKLSGEAMAGPASFGIDPDRVKGLAAEIAAIAQEGIEVGVVVGGGNIFRGIALAREKHGSRDRRSHGHARHRDQFAGSAGRARTDGPAYARDERHPDASGGRALHPAPGHSASGKGPHRDLRGRHFESLFLHRHRGHAARARNQSRRSSPKPPRWTASTTRIR